MTTPATPIHPNYAIVVHPMERRPTSALRHRQSGGVGVGGGVARWPVCGGNMRVAFS